MGWLHNAIRRGVESGVRAAMDNHLDAAIDRAIGRSPLIAFIKAGQMEMLRVDPEMEVRAAWEASRVALVDFLSDEKIQFGDARYDWTPDAAVDLVHAMEIAYWESKP